MSEHNKLLRIFNLIAQMRSPIGCNKSNFSKTHEISERTFERYLSLLRDIGFIIEQKNARYCICSGDLEHENMLSFNLEEASMIRDALVQQNPSQHSNLQALLQKIYALTEINEIAGEIKHQNTNHCISHIQNAIENQQQILLKNYYSLNSDSERNRLVEPIAMISYYKYLAGYDVESQSNKVFRIDRMNEVKIREQPFQYAQQHKTYVLDDFGFAGKEKKEVVVQLTSRARQLLIEEYPKTKNNISVDAELGYIYISELSSMIPLRRFLNGLPQEVHVVAGLSVDSNHF